MNCPNCGVKLASISKFCPECGAKLIVQEEKKNSKAPDSIEELLVTIVQNYGGPELYKESNARKLAGLLKDFAGSNFQDEVKLLSRVVPEGFQEILYNANNSSPEEKQGALAACKMKIIENLFFSEDKAAEATNILVAGLCWKASQTKNTSNDKSSSDIKTSSKNENKQKSGNVQKELLPKGIILNNDTSRVFQTLGEAVKIAKSGSEIKLGPGVYIEPENSPLTEITKKITITGCTENIANKDFSELPIVVLNKENSCKITSDAVIEGVVFTSDENIHFKTLNDYLSKAPDVFSETKTIDYNEWDHSEGKKLCIDEDDFYSLLLIDGNAELKNIAVLKSENYGVTFTSEKGSLADSIVALSSCVNILCSKNTRVVMKNCVCAFSSYRGILIEGDSEPDVSSCDIYGQLDLGLWIRQNANGSYKKCDIHDNEYSIRIEGGSKPKITNCKIYENSSGVFVYDIAEPEVSSCEIYGNSQDGLFITKNAKGSYNDCDIHDNESIGIWVNNNAEPSISGCDIHDNGEYDIKIYGEKNSLKPKISNCKIYNTKTKRTICGVAAFSGEPEITSCEIYGYKYEAVSIYCKGSYNDCDIHDNGGFGIEVNSNAEVSISGCNIHDNKKEGIMITDKSKPKISDCQIHDNKTCGVSSLFSSEPEVTYCEIYGNLNCGLWMGHEAKGSYKDCNIHDNKTLGIKIEGKSEPSISGCDIHDNKENGILIKNETKPKISNCQIYDNKTEGKRYPGVVAKDSSEPEITSCEIYGHLSNGIWIKENAKGSYKNCYIHDNAGAPVDDASDGKTAIQNCGPEKEYIK